MKKIISIITLFFITTSLYANYTMEVKGGLSLSDTYKIGSDTFNGRLTYNLTTEVLYATTDHTEIGIGVSFKANSPTSGEFYNDDSNRSMHLFDSFPIYGIAKYTFPKMGEIQLYVQGYLGTSWNSVGTYEYIESATPGLHTGFGLGGSYGNVTVDLSYVLTQSSVTFYHDNNNDGNYVSETRDASLTSITFTVGYKFELSFLN